IVEEETDRLNDLVSESIEMARIEAGDLRLDRQRHSVGDLISSALRKMSSSLEEREVYVELADDLPDALADGELVGLAMRQLLNNAVKYTRPDSPITVRAQARNGSIIITVADSGPGIPEREQARIFDRFYRISGSSAGVPGTGMGLAIARD